MQAFVLALVALAFPAIGLVPGLAFEGLTIVLLGLAGTVVAVVALLLGIAAFGARRAAHESPVVAATALGISAFVIVFSLFLLPSLVCYVREGCGGGG